MSQKHQLSHKRYCGKLNELLETYGPRRRACPVRCHLQHQPTLTVGEAGKQLLQLVEDGKKLMV